MRYLLYTIVIGLFFVSASEYTMFQLSRPALDPGEGSLFSVQVEESATYEVRGTFLAFV